MADNRDDAAKKKRNIKKTNISDIDYNSIIKISIIGVSAIIVALIAVLILRGNKDYLNNNIVDIGIDTNPIESMIKAEIDEDYRMISNKNTEDSKEYLTELGIGSNDVSVYSVGIKDTDDTKEFVGILRPADGEFDKIYSIIENYVTNTKNQYNLDTRISKKGDYIVYSIGEDSSDRVDRIIENIDTYINGTYSYKTSSSK